MAAARLTSRRPHRPFPPAALLPPRAFQVQGNKSVCNEGLVFVMEASLNFCHARIALLHPALLRSWDFMHFNLWHYQTQILRVSSTKRNVAFPPSEEGWKIWARPYLGRTTNPTRRHTHTRQLVSILALYFVKATYRSRT